MKIIKMAERFAWARCISWRVDDICACAMYRVRVRRQHTKEYPHLFQLKRRENHVRQSYENKYFLSLSLKSFDYCAKE